MPKPLYPCHLNSDTINNNQVGCWLFNEASGVIAYDLSSNLNHGTINGASWVDNGSPLLHFENHDLVSLDPTSLLITGDLSLSTTVITGTSNPAIYPVILSIMGDTGIQGYQITWRTVVDSYGDNEFQFNVLPSGTTWGDNWVRSGVTPQLETSYHLVATRNGTTGELKIYVNGVLEGTFSGDNSPLDFGDNQLAYIGEGVGNTQSYWTGEIDNVRIWDRLLDSTEVTTLYTDPYSGVVSDNSSSYSSTTSSSSSETISSSVSSSSTSNTTSSSSLISSSSTTTSLSSSLISSSYSSSVSSLVQETCWEPPNPYITDVTHESIIVHAPLVFSSEYVLNLQIKTDSTEWETIRSGVRPGNVFIIAGLPASQWINVRWVAIKI